MTAAVIAALVGVALGWTLSLGTDWWRERHRVRTAARLVWAELESAWADIQDALDTANWLEARGHLSTARWQSHGEALASALPFADFDAIDVAYFEVTRAAQDLTAMRDTVNKGILRITHDPETRRAFAVMAATVSDRLQRSQTEIRLGIEAAHRHAGSFAPSTRIPTSDSTAP